MSKGKINDFYEQYEELMLNFEKQEQLLKGTNKLVAELTSTITVILLY